MPSGTLFRGVVSEAYLLQDGAWRVPPGFDTVIVGYQRPGDSRAETLHARFPMRPALLFSPERLNEGVVHIDFHPRTGFSGAILSTNGGVLSSGALQLLAGSGVILRAEAVEFRELNPTNFSALAGTNFTIVAAFEESASAVVPGQEFTLGVSGLETNMTFVLARVIDQSGIYGLEPRARMHTDQDGALKNDEPAGADRLPGLSEAGQYVLLRVAPTQAPPEWSLQFRANRG
jgi:hypothetical protein